MNRITKCERCLRDYSLDYQSSSCPHQNIGELVKLIMESQSVPYEKEAIRIAKNILEKGKWISHQV